MKNSNRESKAKFMIALLIVGAVGVISGAFLFQNILSKDTGFVITPENKGYRPPSENADKWIKKPVGELPEIENPIKTTNEMPEKTTPYYLTMNTQMSDIGSVFKYQKENINFPVFFDGEGINIIDEPFVLLHSSNNFITESKFNSLSPEDKQLVADTFAYEQQIINKNIAKIFELPKEQFKEYEIAFEDMYGEVPEYMEDKNSVILELVTMDALNRFSTVELGEINLKSFYINEHAYEILK